MGAGPGPGHHPASLCYHPAWQDDSAQQQTKIRSGKKTTNMASISPQKPQLDIISANHPAWQDDWPAGQDESSWFGPIILPHVLVCLLPIQIIALLE